MPRLVEVESGDSTIGASAVIVPVMREYWRIIHDQSFANAAQALGLESRVALMIKLLLAVGAIVTLLFWGSNDAARDELVWRVGAALLIAVIFPAFYLWNLVAVPAKMDRELKNKNAIIESLLNSGTADKNRTKFLTALWEEGLEYLSERITNNEFLEWCSKVHDWEIVTLKFLATMYSQQDALDFKVLIVDQKRKMKAINDEHNDKLNHLTQRTTMLRNIIYRNDKSFTPITSDERKIINRRLAEFRTQALKSVKDETP